MAYTLIGGTAVGTVLILLFLPALYAIWFKVKPVNVSSVPDDEQDGCGANFADGRAKGAGIS